MLKDYFLEKHTLKMCFHGDLMDTMTALKNTGGNQTDLKNYNLLRRKITEIGAESVVQGLGAALTVNPIAKPVRKCNMTVTRLAGMSMDCTASITRLARDHAILVPLGPFRLLIPQHFSTNRSRQSHTLPLLRAYTG